ncbi:NAD(P)-dependent oxidoreductase [Lentzea cavernae]|uniref:3-hydroxyisobutyrate dehydrogenase n=1 Tax=Lentzea cavernae TaxID=2020703 RepID=A0ABQ3MFU6_9PSEU|nr:NAD(P)-dependent oxidoreductase [Lentzea cavernae]GHH40072.1 3-hydroxyisobutyrate dehydrogenase [Lentzea cavernae]
MGSHDEDGLTESPLRPGARIAVAGAGRMGLPISRNLAVAGFDVVVTDVRHDLADAVVAGGARWEPSGSAAAAGADVLVTVLPGIPEIRALMSGPESLVRALPAGAAWLDLTSSSPLAMREIQQDARSRGIAVLEAPMGGGPEAADAGTLRLFAGGNPSTFRRLLPLLEVIADPDHVVLVGGSGHGYTAKLLVNLLWFGQAVATAEAVLLGQSAGLDAEALRVLLAGSAAGSEFLRHDLARVFSGDYLPLFGLDRCVEELEAVTELFRDRGVPSELSEVVTRVHRQAAERFGPVDGELMAIALLEERAGALLRPDRA